MIGFPLLFSVADSGSGAGGSRLGGGAGVSTPFTSYLFDKHWNSLGADDSWILAWVHWQNRISRFYWWIFLLRRVLKNVIVGGYAPMVCSQWSNNFRPVFTETFARLSVFAFWKKSRYGDNSNYKRIWQLVKFRSSYGSREMCRGKWSGSKFRDLIWFNLIRLLFMTISTTFMKLTGIFGNYFFSVNYTHFHFRERGGREENIELLTRNKVL